MCHFLSLLTSHLKFLKKVKNDEPYCQPKLLSKFITSIYRKLVITSQYRRWNSFSPQKRKTNRILTLAQQAHVICSPETLPFKQVVYG